MKKILLIEDNLEVRENTSEILTLADYEVISAENGKAGVELAQHELPDLIICDIMMPELDGYGVLHILTKKPETARIPFIFLTAKAEKTDLRKGMLLGADDYLTKPFEDTDLLNAIEMRLKKSALHKKSYSPDAAGLDNFIRDAQRVLNIKELGKDRKVKVLKKKASLFSEGEQPLHIYLVKTGRIKTFRSHPDGKEFITNLYSANDFFGYEPILENRAYEDSAVAMEDSELIAVSKADFLILIQGHKDVSATFISLLCKKVTQKEAQLLNLAYNSVRQRTADALLKLHSGNDKTFLAVSREDLANIAGTATESLIRTLSDFKSEKLIEITGGTISILNEKKLSSLLN